MTDDLIERLRNFEGSDALGNGDFSLLREAAAALEAAREDGWQPIETAPRIELDDLIGWDGRAAFAMQWFENRWVNSLCDVVHPTHWRPLPAPPAIDQARGKGVQGEG